MWSLSDRDARVLGVGVAVSDLAPCSRLAWERVDPSRCTSHCPPQDDGQRDGDRLPPLEAEVDRAIHVALERSGLEASAIEAVIDVSTGGRGPHLAQVGLPTGLPWRDDLQRIPVRAHGPEIGVVALTLALRLARTGINALVLSNECGLTGVGPAHVGEAASAAVATVVGPEGEGPRLRAMSSFHTGERADSAQVQAGASLLSGLPVFLAQEGLVEDQVTYQLLTEVSETHEGSPSNSGDVMLVVEDHGDLRSGTVLAALGQTLWECPGPGTRLVLGSGDRRGSQAFILLEWD